MKTAIDCVRRLQFCAGHRVMGHENKCAHLHGHNYVVHLYARVRGPKLRQALQALATDPIGRVIDFSVLKQAVGEWIDEHWDHGFILNAADVPARNALRSFEVQLRSDTDRVNFIQKVFLLPTNPTAENLAAFLLNTVCPAVLKDLAVEVYRVTVEETENCRANAELSDDQ